MAEKYYPFNTESGAEIIYENPRFLVAFGWDKENDMYSVGLQWGNSANPYPIGQNKQPQWFILHWDLAIEFLRTLIGREGANNEAILKAIHTLTKPQS